MIGRLRRTSSPQASALALDPHWTNMDSWAKWRWLAHIERQSEASRSGLVQANCGDFYSTVAAK
jgi:hypothetical protein